MSGIDAGTRTVAGSCTLGAGLRWMKLSCVSMMLKTAKNGWPGRRLRQCAVADESSHTPSVSHVEGRGAAALAPGRRRAAVAGLHRVVVLLAVVGGVVAGVTQQRREEAHARRQAHQAAHVLPAGRLRIHPGDDGGSRRRADRGGGPYVPIAEAAAGQGVEVRRLRVAIAVDPEVRRVVLAGNPQDVRPRLGRRTHRPGEHPQRHDARPQPHHFVRRTESGVRRPGPIAGRVRGVRDRSAPATRRSASPWCSRSRR